MYESVTYEEILQRMLDRVSEKIDKREGSIIYDTHSPAAIEFQNLYLELDTILKEAYGDTASRDFLVLRCKERGIIPYEATHALLKGVFTPGNLEIPIGTRFSGDAFNYIVTEKMEDGEYQLKCETAGATGNQYFGNLIPITYIYGLQTAVLSDILIPGEDEEETEDLRTRYFSSFDEKAYGGNRKDYMDKVNAIAGVGSTKVTAVWNSDISPGSMIPDEEVISWYESIIGSMEEGISSWLTAVYTAAAEKKLTTGGSVLLTILDAEYNKASEALIKTVQETIDPEETAGEGFGLAPIGHVVSVHTVNEVSIAVKTDLTFESGYGWSNLQSSMDTVMEAYFLELRKKWADSSFLTVRISEIEARLLAISGILDIGNTRINDSESNVSLESNEIPVFGGVTP